MQKILELIEQKKAEHAKLPFYGFLRDRSIAPQERMAFVPCFTFFVMNFTDLNRYVLRELPTTDRLQAIINEHTYEDEDHWIWFLEDLGKLGYDTQIAFTDAMRFIWSDEMMMQRHVVRWMLQRAATTKPVHRLILVEAIEATADIFLATTRAVAEEIRAAGQPGCRYFGELHFGSDAGHTMHSDEMEAFLHNIPLTAEETAEALQIVEETFVMFANLMGDLLAHAKAPKVVNGNFLYSYEMKAKQVHKVKPLGTYLVEAGLLTHEQLSLALIEQRATGQRLGEIIAAYGWLSQTTIEYLVKKMIEPERETLLQNHQPTISASHLRLQAQEALDKALVSV